MLPSSRLALLQAKDYAREFINESKKGRKISCSILQLTTARTLSKCIFYLKAKPAPETENN